MRTIVFTHLCQLGPGLAASNSGWYGKKAHGQEESLESEASTFLLLWLTQRKLVSMGNPCIFCCREAQFTRQTTGVVEQDLCGLSVTIRWLMGGVTGCQWLRRGDM